MSEPSSRPPTSAAAAKLRVAVWVIFGLAIVALAIGPLRVSSEQTRALPQLSPDALTGNAAFTADGLFVSDRFEELPRGLRARGSWLGSDQFQGTHETGWFRAAPKIAIMVAGYPMLAGNRLELELRRTDGSVQRRPFDVHNVGEAWLRWTLSLPPETEAIRIIATDGTTQHGGWLGFSEPFTSHPVIGAQLWSLFQLITASCLALTLIYGPGLLWFGRRARPLSALALAILPGPLLLAALGLLVWILGGIIPPPWSARAGVALLLAWIGWAWPRRQRAAWPQPVHTLVTCSALLVGFAMAKANVSFGPRGELFRDRVSRTLEVGPHSDSQISFHTVQAVAHHLGPYADQTKLYFAPWQFASRGPLAGLMAAPLVLANGAKVPFDHPTHAWRPFDREGFAVYRIACMVLATLAGWVVFALVAGLTSAAWGLIAAATAMLAPFFVHEIYFSWPKLMAAALALVAFWAGHQRQPFVAGVVIAVGYLFHPMAALSAPFVALWVLAQQRDSSWWRRFIAPAWFAAGALVLVVPWQIIGRLQAGGGATQDVFIAYFFFADSAHATWSTWWQSRWDNFANTFIPGYLLTADRAHDSLNSLHGPADRWVQSSFLYWNTLPFALGLPGFALSVLAIAEGCRRALGVTLVCLLGPALLLVAYWGAATTGLMRQCGHALFLSVIVFTLWRVARWPKRWEHKTTALFLHPACFAWRGFEVAAMAFGVTLMNWRHDFSDLFRLNDALSLSLALVCLTSLVVLLAQAARAEARAHGLLVDA